MNHKDRIKLRFGRYRTPRFKYGDVVFCKRWGEVKICGLSSGRIPWPTCRRGSNNALVLCADLVKAVRQESSITIQHWWGVGYDTVWKWRKVLGVDPYTAGTRAIRSDYAKEPRYDAIRAKAWAKARNPERCAKIAAARRGKPRPPQLMQALAEFNRRPT